MTQSRKYDGLTPAQTLLGGLCPRALTEALWCLKLVQCSQSVEFDPIVQLITSRAPFYVFALTYTLCCSELVSRISSFNPIASQIRTINYTIFGRWKYLQNQWFLDYREGWFLEEKLNLFSTMWNFGPYVRPTNSWKKRDSHFAGDKWWSEIDRDLAMQTYYPTFFGPVLFEKHG